VARAGGVVAACVWGYADGRGPLGPFWEAAREIDPDPADESRLAGARQGHLTDLLKGAGLAEVDEVGLSVSRDFPDFDAW